MESGEYKVGLDTLFKILHVFELSMSRFFEETPEAEEKADVLELHGESEVPEREQLLADFAQLSDESRREVREFIAFKRQQAETRRPKWPAPNDGPEGAVGEGSDAEDRVPGGTDGTEDGEAS